MNIASLTSKSFSSTIAKHKLVVVDFYADWCQPCQAFAKVIERMAPNYPEVLFAKVDIEAEKELADDFNIMSVPAVMLLRDQVVLYAESGLLSESSLRELIEQAKNLDMNSIK